MKTFWKTFFGAFSGTLAALILNLILIFIFIGAIIAASSSSSEPVIPKEAVLKIDLSQSIGERSQDGMSDFNITSLIMGGNMQSSVGIYDAVRAIKHAATDPRIKFILITNNNETNIGTSNLEELREALAKFHDAGKAIIAYGENFTLGGYYLASIADKIYINNEGSANFTGIGSSVLYLKDALDKFGVKVQLIRHGKFKAAGEPFISSEMSPANKEQSERELRSVWETWRNQICAQRGIAEEELDKALDELQLGSAQSLVNLRLADSSITSANMNQRLCELAGVKSIDKLKTVSLASYAQVHGKSTSAAKNKIAVLYGNGEITMDSGSGIIAPAFCKEIRKIAADSSIKAVVFRVNSPGGDAQAAELIREEIQLLREVKPVVCSYGGYAASGGYWFSAQSDRIFSNRTTFTGSIGVFSLFINYGDALKKTLDINPVLIGTHKHSAMTSNMRPLDNEEVAYMQQFVEDIYTKFINIAADGRHTTAEYIDSIGQGRVWTGADGLKINLVDQIGGIEDAVNYTADLVGLEDYKVVEYPRTKTSFESLLENFSGDNSAKVKIDLSNPEATYKSVYKYFTKGNKVKMYARVPYIMDMIY